MDRLLGDPEIFTAFVQTEVSFRHYLFFGSPCPFHNCQDSRISRFTVGGFPFFLSITDNIVRFRFGKRIVFGSVFLNSSFLKEDEAYTFAETEKLQPEKSESTD